MMNRYHWTAMLSLIALAGCAHSVPKAEYSSNVNSLIPEVISARQAAIAANAPKTHSDDFKDAEEELADLAKDIDGGKSDVSGSKRAELQKEYNELEVKALKVSRLGPAMGKIRKAKDEKAKKYAPRSFADAEMKYSVASKTIEANRNNPTLIDPAVKESDDQAQMLTDVMAVILASDKKTDEMSAVAMVNQRKQLASKEQDLNKKEAELNASEMSVAQRTRALEAERANSAALGRENSALGQQNSALSEEARLNRALTEGQKMFGASEAQVYREGDQLVVRLKQMAFPTGKAELPEASKATLAKVTKVIEMLSAEKVLVEGHTDTVGSRITNETLSQKRADTVKEYLVEENAIEAAMIEAKGLGFEKPIASNKSASGRAQNRRVDIVITPSQVASAGTTK